MALKTALVLVLGLSLCGCASAPKSPPFKTAAVRALCGQKLVRTGATYTFGDKVLGEEEVRALYVQTGSKDLLPTLHDDYFGRTLYGIGACLMAIPAGLWLSNLNGYMMGMIGLPGTLAASYFTYAAIFSPREHGISKFNERMVERCRPLEGN